MKSRPVFMFPPWEGKNPFLRLLSESLREHGVPTAFCKDFRSLVRLAVAPRRAAALHLHWLDPIASGGVASFVVRLAALALVLVRFRLARVPVVWTVHNLHAHDDAGSPKRHRWTGRLVGGLASEVVHMTATAQSLAAETLRVPARKSRVIPHGHYIDVVGAPLAAERARAELGIAPHARVFLFLGLLRPYKGLLELVEAFNATEHGRERVLVIAGEPCDALLQARLEAACGGHRRILLHPWRVREVSAYAGAADVMVFPYRNILNSGAVHLSLSTGKPFIAPAMGSLRELSGLPFAFLYAPGPTGLRERLEEVAAIPAARLAQVGDDARAWVRRHGDWNAIGEQYREAYGVRARSDVSSGRPVSRIAIS